MSSSHQLLLTENVDNLGIVGDVVTVRSGYARNYLLPRGLATKPSDEMIVALQAKRKDAERMLGELRAQREDMVHRLNGFELTLERPCNDQGVLYGAVTQQDLADQLGKSGFEVRPRDVRLPHAIKRIDTYDVHIKFASDLESVIKLWVVADRKLDTDEREEMEFDNEGNLIEQPRTPRAPRGAPAAETPPAE